MDSQGQVLESAITYYVNFCMAACKKYKKQVEALGGECQQHGVANCKTKVIELFNTVANDALQNNQGILTKNDQIAQQHVGLYKQYLLVQSTSAFLSLREKVIDAKDGRVLQDPSKVNESAESYMKLVNDGKKGRSVFWRAWAFFKTAA